MTNVDFIKDVERIRDQEKIPTFKEIFNNIFEERKLLKDKKASIRRTKKLVSESLLIRS